MTKYVKSRLKLLLVTALAWNHRVAIMERDRREISEVGLRT